MQYARDVHRREASRTTAVGHLMRYNGTANEVLLWRPDGSLRRCHLDMTSRDTFVWGSGLYGTCHNDRSI